MRISCCQIEPGDTKGLRKLFKIFHQATKRPVLAPVKLVKGAGILRKQHGGVGIRGILIV